MGLGSVVVVRGGLRVIVGGGAVLVVGGTYVVLGPGIGGKGSIAVCCLTASFAMTSATTNPMTSSTAPPATNHSHRGDRGGGGPSDGCSSVGGRSCCQYGGGNCWVALGW